MSRGNRIRSKRSVREYLHDQEVARAKLAAVGIEVGADFHTLSTGQVEALLAFADADKYRKPGNANGSRGRYYHDRLQRRAAPRSMHVVETGNDGGRFV